MKIGHLSSKIAGVILGLALLFVIGAGSVTTGHAQYRHNDQDRRGQKDGYGDYGGSYELRQTALNAGYNEGIREGSYDRQDARRSNYRDLDVYQRATKGYNSRLGDRELYRRYFREAFENGYDGNSNGNGRTDQGRDDRYSNRDRNDRDNRSRRGRNWDGYGNYGGSPQLRQTALNAGYNEGIRQGHKDRNKRNSYGFQSQSAYQKATKDYNSRLGDRAVYQHYFRAAYESGFSDGVNGY